jgi:hypothetical protein
MSGYLVSLKAPIEGLIFASPSALSEEYALPSAFRYFKKFIDDNYGNS